MMVTPTKGDSLRKTETYYEFGKTLVYCLFIAQKGSLIYEMHEPAEK